MNIDKREINKPNTRAWFLVTFPVGIGLRHVLFINASTSASYHIFKEPAAPAPSATAIIDIEELMRSTLFGDINKPTTQVKITRDITLGFIS